MRAISDLINSTVRGVVRVAGGRFLPCCILSRTPLVITAYWADFLAENESILSLLPEDRNSFFLFMFGGYKGTGEAMREVQQQVRALNDRYPSVSFYFLCNSRREQELAKSEGLRSVFCHQNAFLDERRYQILPKVKKRFDAVYVARFSPEKRHALAVEIKRLKLIGSYASDDEEYFQHSRHLLAHAEWIPRVPEIKISRHLAEAWVGLSLSSAEGAAFACTEYLLCGLPVVTAGSVRGYEVLFDDSFVLVSPDTPQAVSAVVDELKKREFDPLLIRSRTIEKMKAHRQVLIDTVQSIYDQENSSRRFADHFPGAFIHKLGVRCALPLHLQLTRVLRTNMQL